MKLKRIKLAYEHLVQRNKAYKQKAACKCRCGYFAMTEWDLERHQQCGYVGRGASTHHQSIWCCLCDDGIRYTAGTFSTHMMKQHDVKARITVPIIKPCPFCPFSGPRDATTSEHIEKCQKMFNPDFNLCCPSRYDFPLVYSSSQPRYGVSLPQNAVHTGGSLHAAKCIPVSNTAAHIAAVSVLPSPVRHTVPVALFTGARARGISSTCSATSTLPYPVYAGSPVSGIASGVLAASRMSVPSRMPGVPFVVSGSGLGSQTLMSGGTSSSLYSFRPQQPNIYGSHSAMNLALNYYRSLQLPRPLMSVRSLTSVSMTEVARDNMPRTTGHRLLLPLSSPQYMHLTPAAGQTNSGLRKTVKNLQMKGARTISGYRGTLPPKQNASVSSARKAVVVLRRLSVSPCEACGLVFEKPEPLCRHLQTAHSIAVDEKDFAQGSAHKSLSCVCCSLKFFGKQGLDRHMKIVHEILSGVYTCPRCSETSISDLFEHFHLKHGISVRNMVEWQVCHICKLNFSSVTDVEKHVMKEHNDVFPTRLHFRQKLCSRNHTTSETQRQKVPVNVGTNGIGCSDHSQPMVDMSRKCHSSVSEIAEDSSDPKSGDSNNVETVDKKQVSSICITDVATHIPSAHGDVYTAQAVNNKRKRENDNMVDLMPSDAGAVVRTPGSKPATKKIRRSSSVSAEDMNCHTPYVPMVLSPRNKAHKQHLPCSLDEDAVPGVVSHDMSKNAAVDLRPPTEESNVADKSVVPNAETNSIACSDQVHLIPLISMHKGSSDEKVKIHSTYVEDLSVEPPSKSFGSSTIKPTDVSDVIIERVDSAGAEESLSKEDKEQYRYVFNLLPVITD